MSFGFPLINTTAFVNVACDNYITVLGIFKFSSCFISAARVDAASSSHSTADSKPNTLNLISLKMMATELANYWII